MADSKCYGTVGYDNAAAGAADGFNHAFGSAANQLPGILVNGLMSPTQMIARSIKQEFKVHSHTVRN